MDKYDKSVLEIELSKGIPCELKHEDTGVRFAVTYINQKIGYTNKPIYDIVIPICQDCLDGINSPEWILLYCLRCTHNQWVFKPLGKLDYRKKHICWMSCCPDCKSIGEKANIFFTD